ncbi:mfs allantoate protein [Fusarium flagelliforme]|uniref:Mfs allantoate protein n=1 Tax=Fusarium flagelliforme TaxID=2675880 RepID=A0A395MW20_9HYPO|nr:mfs allantoate protein [Fusarium flagelliforme]
MAQSEDDDEAWDPIEGMEYDKRNQYIDLIKHFFWMPIDIKEPTSTAEASSETPAEASSSATPSEPKAPAPAAAAKTLKKKKKKKGKAKSNANKAPDFEDSLVGQLKLLAMHHRAEEAEQTELQEPDKNNIETEEEMRKRLSEGVKKNLDNLSGMQIVGTLENPHETWDKTAPLPQDEIDSLIRDIREIKLFLFCRLVLSQVSLLPAALRANSVQEFLNDSTIAEADLRDLCLKVAEPTLQNIRDACADFARGDKPDERILIEDDDDDDDETMADIMRADRRYHHLHTDDWFTDRVSRYGDKKKRKYKKSKSKSKSKSKVTICGKSIWDHASENAMSRDGWLQFSIMAKDCDIKHAIQLCRNWNEFSDLNLLSIWHYFPASNWTAWGMERFMQQLQQLGFFPYFTDFGAESRTHHDQVGGRSTQRRAHSMIEARNIIVGNMKRNDPVTRRFIQYLLMRAGEVLVMVRDGKAGRVITAPPKDELWTLRRKQGLGRASKNDWEDLLSVGPEFMK